MRQFLLNKALDSKGRVTVTGKDVKYLTKVLRLTCGDTFAARTVTGELCTMRLEQKDGAKLVLQRVGGTVSVPENASNGAPCNVQSADASSAPNASCMHDSSCDPRCIVQTAAPNAAAPLQVGSSMHGGVRAELVAGNAHGTRIWLLQCMPRAAKFDTIIRQATETGVERIFPVLSDRSVQEGSCGSAKIERWNRIVREARQQSASAVETTVAKPMPMADALKELNRCSALLSAEGGESAQSAHDIRLVLTEMPSSPLERKTLHGYLTKACKAVILAVGSEGGISPAEYERLRADGFMPLHFETNILRTETAAIYGIAAVQTLLTEFSSWHRKE